MPTREDIAGRGMVKPLRQGIARMKANPVGTIAGGIGSLIIARRYARVSNPYLLAGIVILGAYVGANAQRKIFAFRTRPSKRMIEAEIDG